MAVNPLHEPIYFTPAPVRGRYLTGLWKGGGDAPETPDPVKTAAAQGEANIEAARVTTALGNADQITPYGSLTWKQGGSGSTFDQSGFDAAMKQYQADMDVWNTKRSQATTPHSGQGLDAFGRPDPEAGGVYDPGQDAAQWEAANARPTTPGESAYMKDFDPDKWTSTVTLDPRVQALLDRDLETRAGMEGATGAALERATTTLAKDPMTGLPAAASASGSLESARGNFTDPAADLMRSRDLAQQGGQLAGGQLDRLQDLYSTDFNYNGATAMPEANEAARQSVEDALYGRATSRLDPKYNQSQSDLDSRLATQGITQGSAAWARENQNLGMARNDAYQNARDSAVSNSTTEMAKLFSMGLASRQQGVTEANTLRALPSQEATLAAQLNSGFGTDNRGYYGTELAQETAIPNIASAEYNMQANERGTALGEQNAQRQQVLNELSALRTGAQVSMPTFGNGSPGAAVGAAPVAQSVYNSYQGDLSNYNAQVGSTNAMNSGMATLGAAAIAAFM